MKKGAEEKCIRNQYGFFELSQKPSPDELKKYYAEKYYQEERSTYSRAYPGEEVAYFFHKIEQKYHLVKGKLLGRKNLSLLDVGCGEGFTLKYFDDLGWDVTGVDFSDHGCRIHHPGYLDRMITGDIFETLVAISRKKKKYHLLWLDNVLEHVLDPLKLLKLCRKLGTPDSYLLVEVPNDFSVVQRKAVEDHLIEDAFWVVDPDHISYFNREGLAHVAGKAGWEMVTAIGDFPIDFNLFNENSNYIRDRQKGKGAHQQRYRLENLMHSLSVEKVNRFYQALGDLGLGRQIIALLRKS